MNGDDGWTCGKATSMDGITWTKVDLNSDTVTDILLSKGELGEWDADIVHCPEAFLWNGKVRVLFGGRTGGSSVYQMGLAIANDVDGLGYSLQKYGQVTDEETSPFGSHRIRTPIIIGDTLYARLSENTEYHFGASSDGGVTWDYICELTHDISNFMIEDEKLYGVKTYEHTLVYKDLNDCYQVVANTTSLDINTATPITLNLKKQLNLDGEKIYFEDIIYDDFYTDTLSEYKAIDGTWSYNASGHIQTIDSTGNQRRVFDDMIFNGGVMSIDIYIPSNATNKQEAGVYLPYISATKYVSIVIDEHTNDLDLKKYNGTLYTLDTSSPTIDPDTWYTLTVFWSPSGGYYKVYLDDPTMSGPPILEAHDTQYPSGKIGFKIYYCQAYLDNLYFEPLRIKKITDIP